MRSWLSWAIAARWAGLFCSLTACARPMAPPGSPPAPSPLAAARPLTARPEFGGWMLAPDAPAGNDVRTAPDGSRYFILRGTRWIDHPDGSTERSRQVFVEDDVKAVPLPQHLGAGYLFHVTSGAGTLLWRADTWTGDLRALGRVEPPASEIALGFDRLYLTSATSYGLRALDAFSGKALDTSPLPPAPAYGDMVFSDAWMAVVLTGLRGALATFDAGESWHRVPTSASVTELEPRDAGVLLTTERGRFELTREGQLVPVNARGSDAPFRGTNTFTDYAPSAFATDEPRTLERARSAALGLGPRPLRAAVLRGWPDTPATAVVIEEGVLGRVRLSDGEVLSARPFAGNGPCRGVALGLGFGFVCGDSRESTQIYEYASDRLKLELSLDGPHAVRSSGNGGLVIAAGCDAVHRSPHGTSPPAARPGPPAPDRNEAVARYCVRQVSGELFDVRVRGEVGMERVAALRDGRVAVLIPPRSSAPGRLSLIGPGGTTSVELSLDADSGSGVRLVRSGLWLDELWESETGELGAWVVGAQAFVGVRVALNGKVQIARVQEGVDETSFFGPDALHLAGAASLRETTDQGFEWRISALPPAVLAPASGTRSRWPLRGCSAVGCVYDDWLRIGFSGERGVPEPARPPLPERVAFEGSRFAFWTLSCDAAREPSRRASERVPASARSAEAAGGSDRRPPGGVPESSAWLSFQGEPPPERRPSDVGYDYSVVNENGAYHAYVWGPAQGGWSRRGVWQARVGDRFTTAPPWSSAVSRSPWSEPAAAAQAFGLDSSTGVDWWFRFGASDESGVLQLRVRSESSIHLLERDRAIVTLDLSKLPDLGVVTGALPVGDRWYVGATRAEQFHLYRVDGDRPTLVGTFPVLGRAMTQLVGSVNGDELGIWARSQGSGWQVFPVDLERFEVQPPVQVPIDKLGRVPPPCEPGRPGWIAVAGVPLTDAAVSESNTHVDFTGRAEGLRTKRLTARVLIDEGGLCVDALAAVVDGPGPGDLSADHAPPRRDALPLVVTDPVDERRWAFRCSP